MPTDTLPSAPAATFGTPVEITAIARELKKLWQADQTRTRASLINFAIICEGEAAMQDSTELLERFVRNHSFAHRRRSLTAPLKPIHFPSC